MLLFGICQSYAQCDYAEYSDSPDELYRKRLSNVEVGSYTMFNRSKYDTWSLSKISTLVNKLNHHEN